MRLAYRDDGLWILCWLVLSSLWKHGHNATFPPRGFVGLASSSSLAIEPKAFRLSSIALRKLPSTLGGRLWRLTFGWEISPGMRSPSRYGELSETDGSSSSQVPGGAATFPTRM